MSFYKILRAGHVGGGRDQELIIYISSESYTQAMKRAKRFPAVKHNKSNAVLRLEVVQEREYILGSMINGYSKLNNGTDEYFNKLEKMAKKFIHLKDYKFETDEGKILKDFVDRYIQESAEDKPAIEQEYYNWAQSLVDSNQLVR